MPRKKAESFAEFLAQPHVGTALIVLGLIALVFSIMEFSKALSYYSY
jgi:hypothetical protein